MSTRHRRSYSSSSIDDDKSARGSYVTIACTFCKKRHFKCDGNPDGCANCSKRGQECNYVQPTQKRGPKRKKGNASKRAKIVDAVDNTDDTMSPPLVVNHRSITRSQTKSVSNPATPSPSSSLSSTQTPTQQIINYFHDGIDSVAASIIEGTLSAPLFTTPYLETSDSCSDFSDFAFSLSPLGSDDSDDLFSEQNDFSEGSPLTSSSPIDGTLLFTSEDQTLFTTDFVNSISSSSTLMNNNDLSNNTNTLNKTIRLLPVTEFVNLPETLFNSDLNGTMSPSQTIVSYLYIYQRSMDTFMPSVELPFLWDQRVKRITGQFNSSTKDDDTVCMQFLNGDMNASTQKPIEDMLDDIKIYIMLAIGARFCKRRDEALQFLSVGRELLRSVYDRPFIQVGWTHMLLAQFYFGEGDIKNAAISNSLALTCASCLSKQPSEEQKSLLMGSLVFSIILVKNPEERRQRMETIRANEPQPLQLTFANFFYVTELLLEELRTGVKGTFSYIDIISEMESSFHKYVLSPANAFLEAGYRYMVGEIVLYSIQGLVHLRDGNRTTALRLASQVSAMAKRLNYCCAGIPFATCFAAVVFQKLNVRNEDYYTLLQVIDKFSAIYPCLSLILSSLNVPHEDISRARSGQFALIQPQLLDSSASLWEKLGQQFLVDSFFNTQ